MCGGTGAVYQQQTRQRFATWHALNMPTQRADLNKLAELGVRPSRRVKLPVHVQAAAERAGEADAASAVAARTTRDKSVAPA